MSREKPYYREVLADLSERFNDKMQVRIGEVCTVLKMTPCAARSRYSFDKNGWISLYTLARDICEDF